MRKKGQKRRKMREMWGNCQRTGPSSKGKRKNKAGPEKTRFGPVGSREPVQLKTRSPLLSSFHLPRVLFVLESPRPTQKSLDHLCYTPSRSSVYLPRHLSLSSSTSPSPTVNPQNPEPRNPPTVLLLTFLRPIPRTHRCWPSSQPSTHVIRIDGREAKQIEYEEDAATPLRGSNSR